uniref:Uncharacterized protein n=1 Tax=Aotus nancymaae TaxID=37293 RepID=A0A2K5CU72_AOTNA
MISTLYKNTACISTCKSAYSNINQSMQDNLTECKFTQCMIKCHRLAYCSLPLYKGAFLWTICFSYPILEIVFVLSHRTWQIFTHLDCTGFPVPK